MWKARSEVPVCAPPQGDVTGGDQPRDLRRFLTSQGQRPEELRPLRAVGTGAGPFLPGTLACPPGPVVSAGPAVGGGALLGAEAAGLRALGPPRAVLGQKPGALATICFPEDPSEPGASPKAKGEAHLGSAVRRPPAAVKAKAACS